MIVSEKYRDIGIMKSLGASNRGVMSIFVGYGLLLGAVGVVLGTILGLTITDHINEIEKFLTQLSGRAAPARDLLLQGNPDQRRTAECNGRESRGCCHRDPLQPPARVARPAPPVRALAE